MATMVAGFASPVFDSQRAFRAIMNATAYPGRIATVGGGLEPPSPLGPAAAAFLLTLADFETPVFLSASLAGNGALADFLRFHTGAKLGAAAGEAAFALVHLAHDALDLAAYAQGTPDYPDRATTVIALAEAISAEGGLVYAGPGIRGSANLAFAPCPADFPAQWTANRARFPLGIDLVLAAGDRLACLPRSLQIRAEAR
jgi:alpha-D-ribose 1-methylphosphonate 5-triphosphate synthase subunit PhnH